MAKGQRSKGRLTLLSRGLLGQPKPCGGSKAPRGRDHRLTETTSSRSATLPAISLSCTQQQAQHNAGYHDTKPIKRHPCSLQTAEPERQPVKRLPLPKNRTKHATRLFHEKLNRGHTPCTSQTSTSTIPYLYTYLPHEPKYRCLARVSVHMR